MALILPGGVARTALLEVPAGVTAARVRALPHHAEPALRAGRGAGGRPARRRGGRVLAGGGAPQRGRGYEAVAAAAGLDVGAAGPRPAGRPLRARPRAARHRRRPSTSSWAITPSPSPPGRAACFTSSARRLRDAGAGRAALAGPRGGSDGRAGRQRIRAHGSAPSARGRGAAARLGGRGSRGRAAAGARKARCPCEAAELAWLGAALA